MNGWNWVVWLHVLSAVIGIGPTFFMPVFVRKRQTRQMLNHSLDMMAKLEIYPKIGGPLAVLSGIALVVFREYGSFLQVWQIGSLLLFIAIQIIVIGFLVPRTKKLHASLAHVKPGSNDPLDAEQTAQTLRIRQLIGVTLLLSAVLFSFMILRP